MNPVVWFEIYVTDMPRAKAFYEAVLQLRLEPMQTPAEGLEEMVGFPMNNDAPGSAGALVRMDGAPVGAGGTIVYFSCDDCAVEAGRVAANGGQVLREKFSIGAHGFIAMIVDPDGNVIGLHSMT